MFKGQDDDNLRTIAKLRTLEARNEIKLIGEELAYFCAENCKLNVKLNIQKAE